MRKISELLEESERNQFLGLCRIDRLSISMVSILNQNLFIILVGITLSFTVEYTLRFSEMIFVDGKLRFILYGLTTLSWILLSIVQVMHTVKFIILQDDLPIINVRNRKVNITAAVAYLLSIRLKEVRKLSILFVLIILLAFIILLTILIQFLEINSWISFSGIIEAMI